MRFSEQAKREAVREERKRSDQVRARNRFHWYTLNVQALAKYRNPFGLAMSPVRVSATARHDGSSNADTVRGE
jgi:hypothetical protein